MVGALKVALPPLHDAVFLVLRAVKAVVTDVPQVGRLTFDPHHHLVLDVAFPRSYDCT